MPAVLIGIAVLVIALIALNGFTKANVKGLAQGARIGRGLAAMVAAASGAFSQPSPTGFARGVRSCAGILVLAGAAFVGARGAILTAASLAVFGAGLLGWSPAQWFREGRRTRGQASRVRSAFLEMELDHDTDAIRGRIISGAYAGTSLDALELSVLIALQSEFDPESGSLLVAYLDRRDPRWREYAQAGPTAGQGAARSTGKMSEQEAYQILGLQPGASREEISRAHHALMKKLHPDQGGSTYLAARVNEAKEVLTRRHR
jgi:DnaJ-domain-containing protein 1